MRRALGRLRLALYRRALARRGVEVGTAVRLMGMPILERHDTSSIVIGDRVVLCSDPKKTALGVNHPVILRTLAPEAQIVIGDDTGLSGTSICAVRSVTVGRRVLVGANVEISDTDFHPVEMNGRRYAGLPSGTEDDRVVIGDDIFLGAGVRVLKGVKIGDGAIVAAGAVVTHDVAPRTVVAGVPAVVVGSVP